MFSTNLHNRAGGNGFFQQRVQIDDLPDSNICAIPMVSAMPALMLRINHADQAGHRWNGRVKGFDPPHPDFRKTCNGLKHRG